MVVPAARGIPYMSISLPTRSNLSPQEAEAYVSGMILDAVASHPGQVGFPRLPVSPRHIAWGAVVGGAATSAGWSALRRMADDLAERLSEHGRDMSARALSNLARQAHRVREQALEYAQSYFEQHGSQPPGASEVVDELVHVEKDVHSSHSTHPVRAGTHGVTPMGGGAPVSLPSRPPNAFVPSSRPLTKGETKKYAGHLKTMAVHYESEGYGKWDNEHVEVAPFCDEIVGAVVPQSAYTAVAVPLNPGLASVFPLLSRIAQLYDMYKFVELTFEFVVMAPTSTAGLFVMAVDPDALDAPPVSSADFVAQSWRTKPGSIWTPHSFSVPVKALTAVAGSRYVRTGPRPASDERLNDSGTFLYAVEGVSGTGIVSGSGTIGKIYAKGVVLFQARSIDRGLAPSVTDWTSFYTEYNSLVTTRTSANNGIAFGLGRWTTPSTTWLENGLAISRSVDVGNTLSLTFPYAGTFLVTYSYRYTVVVTGTTASTSGGVMDVQTDTWVTNVSNCTVSGLTSTNPLRGPSFSVSTSATNLTGNWNGSWNECQQFVVRTAAGGSFFIVLNGVVNASGAVYSTYTATFGGAGTLANQASILVQTA